MRQERFVPEFLNFDGRPFRQRMLGVHDENEIISQNPERLEFAISGLECQQREVHVVVEHFAGQALGGMAKNFYHHIRIKGSVIQNELRQKIKRSTFVSADADAATPQSL